MLHAQFLHLTPTRAKCVCVCVRAEAMEEATIILGNGVTLERLNTYFHEYQLKKNLSEKRSITQDITH